MATLFLCLIARTRLLDAYIDIFGGRFHKILLRFLANLDVDDMLEVSALHLVFLVTGYYSTRLLSIVHF